MLGSLQVIVDAESSVRVYSLLACSYNQSYIDQLKLLHVNIRSSISLKIQ